MALAPGVMTMHRREDNKEARSIKYCSLTVRADNDAGDHAAGLVPRDSGVIKKRRCALSGLPTR
jgi:hypothetical protein